MKAQTLSYEIWGILYPLPSRLIKSKFLFFFERCNRHIVLAIQILCATGSYPLLGVEKDLECGQNCRQCQDHLEVHKWLDKMSVDQFRGKNKIHDFFLHLMPFPLN